MEIRPDASVLASGRASPRDRYDVEVEGDLGGASSIRLEALADPSHPAGGPGRAPNGNFVLTRFQVIDERGRPIRLTAGRGRRLAKSIRRLGRDRR